MSKYDDDYEVGYGKPPKRNQFQRGSSGNPKGRPKGSRNLNTVFREICEQRVKVKEGGGQRLVTKLEAALMQLTNKAATGDLKAIKEVIRLNQSLPFDKDYLAATAPIFHVNFIEAEEGRPKYPQEANGNLDSAEEE